MKFNAQRAKCALIRAKKTQTQLSEELKISRQCISKAVNGGNIATTTAHCIAQALGVPMETLLEDTRKGEFCD